MTTALTFGHYPKDGTRRDRWTGIGSVGEVFDGQTFTMRQYLHKEDQYVRTLFVMLAAAGIDHLQVEENILEEAWEPSGLNGETVDLAAVDRICRKNLRDEHDVRLRGPGFFAYWGWDMYMTIEVEMRWGGRYVEPLVSAWRSGMWIACVVPSHDEQLEAAGEASA